MLEIKCGVLKQPIFSRPGIEGYAVEVNGREEKCIVYTDLVGKVKSGDQVLLNTTAETLHLGSGGYHYVIAGLNGSEKSLPNGGHIMKLRYTPLQIKVLSAEEEGSPYHQELKDADSLEGIPVLAATLHSMLGPLALELHQAGFKTAYLMTDGAALPLQFSQTVDWLARKGIIAGTVTVGHAFGGDVEAVNVYSGLLAARAAFHPDVIIVSMGPGIVGTGTRWGFSGVEQGIVLNAVETLQGVPIAVPRISFADARPRHQGISHHTLTVLARVCKVRCLLPLPLLSDEQMSRVLEQARQAGLFDLHEIYVEPAEETLDRFRRSELQFTTMGRTVEQDREFYMALVAAARLVQKLLTGQELNRINLV
ncbi:MAG TPA: DUF3866 family protein [Syntrophomonadaceae bacterium]|nr:DUF3866 family protein [Syntrophomonadaceae bacterium]HQE23977.1 DUF3866 family protein [Syntrophomonadaceae bacterium]